MKGYTRLLLLAGCITVLALVVINFPTHVSGKGGQQKTQKAQKTQTDRGGEENQIKTMKPKVKPTPDIQAEPDEANENDPDRPNFAKGLVNHAEYLRRRQEWVNYKLGMDPGKPYDPMIRQESLKQMKLQESKLKAEVAAGRISPRVLSSSWTNIGPFPLPNGQTNSVETPVSGRTISIAVHPTDADIVYVGTAQGGLYRSTNGGQSWTQLFDAADSQVIGAIAIAPSNPEIVYVGTGENGQCGSGCYAGVGVYRIDNASTTATLTGPINPQITTGVTTTVTYNAFTGRSISEILVAPTDPSVIFVGTASAIVGNPNQAPQGGTVPPLGLRGVYRINNANGPIAGMTITKLIVTAQPGGFDVPSTGNRSIMDLALDPADPTGNTFVAFVNGTNAANDGGVYRTTNALTTGTFTQTHSPITSNIRGEFAVTRAAGVTTMYLAAGETGLPPCNAAGQGSVRKSVDGGVTWSNRLASGGGFCGGQCFYDIAVASDPTDPNKVLLGGNVPGTCTRNNARSTDGGATFPERSTGLHADSHAVTYAPSNPNVVYQGNDGGIYRSDDNGQTWTSLNNRSFVATQFQSIASHPTERYFLLGGTQDNGTELLQPTPFSQLPYDGWKNADFGDGGYARIDQTATDTENVVMYHTYFNQTNAQAIARVTQRADARKGNWPFFGCGFGGVIPNGFNCTTTTACLFYAPFELGPAGVVGATGQTVYWGSDALYRSINQAATFVPASQQPIVSGQAVASLAIAPSDDTYRVVGLTNGTVWGTATGAAVLVNITPTGMSGTRTVGKLVFDPNDKNTAFVGYGGQFGLSGIPVINHIWKTTNFNAATPTWTAVANGLPDTAVNTLAVDPANSSVVFAGTDVGVYRSIDGGINWLPYNSGMPKIAVFDMAIQNANRLLRIATHGRGIWEIGLDPSVTISGQITGANSTGVTMQLTGSAPAPLTTVTDGGGKYTFSGLSVGGNYTVRPVATAIVAFTPTNRTYPDVPSSRTGQDYVTTAPPPPVPGLPLALASPGEVIITELRLRGGVGGNDEYVELYNNTNSDITVSTSDGSDGWALDGPVAGTRVNIAVVPVGTVIPARGHYLLAASSFSLNSRATGDFFYSTGAANGVDDNTGVALYSTSNRANFAAGNRLDAAGFAGAPVQDREGAGFPNIATNDGDYALVRKLDGFASYVDTTDNANDFVLVSPTGAVGATLATLGAPSPENVASPIQRNAQIRASFVDPTVSASLPPNRVRDATETGVNKDFGTLVIRRRFTNNTGQTLTRLRFRIMDITTLNSAGAGPGQADIRALNSGDVIVMALTIKGTTVELPPAQLLGGGLNSALNVTLPDVGLAPLVAGVCVTGQCSVNVQFKLGVVQGGAYRFFVNVEALP